MTARRYLQLDVFADRPGAGNALGVVIDAEGLDAAAMQSIAGWTNLSETIFLLRPDDSLGAGHASADYRVRIFTPMQELPFAGHPSVGAAWAVLDQGLATPRDGMLMQSCAAGVLPVRVNARGDAITTHVRAPRARLLPMPDGADALLAAANAGQPMGASAPALWNNGPSWWLVELADGASVRAMQPDLPAIAALTTATGAVGLCVYGHGHDPDLDIVVRAYCPADNIPEDPVTGSANALVAAALAARDALPRADGRYIASQGREVGRDGRVEVRVDEEGEVWVGGRVQAVIRGSFVW